MKFISTEDKPSVRLLLFLLLGLTAVIGSLFHSSVNAAPTTTCNAPTETQTIQQVLWDANCDIVHVVDGVHNVQKLLIDRNLILEGSGAAAVILDGGGVDSVIAIYNNPTDVLIRGLTIRNGGGSSNGGGISMDNGTVVIENSRIIDNATTSVAGGLINYGGSLTIRQSEISGNSAGGYAGGLHSNPGTTVNLENVTISGNSANSAGGISNGGTMTMTNVTVADNTAVNGFSPGINNNGTIQFQNSIVANGSGLDCRTDGGGVFNSLGHNLEDGDSCGFTQSSDLTSTDPRLKPLAANKGETYTRALQPDSPAVDAGGSCPATDQRGVARPHDGNGDGTAVCDIGAYELNEFPVYLPLARK